MIFIRCAVNSEKESTNQVVVKGEVTQTFDPARRGGPRVALVERPGTASAGSTWSLSKYMLRGRPKSDGRVDSLKGGSFLKYCFHLFVGYQ